MTELPRDARGTPIQALSIGDTAKYAVTSTETLVTIPSGCRVARFKATVDCFLKSGEGVTTSDLLLEAGETEYFAVNAGETYTVIRSLQDGFLHVTDMQ